MAEQASGATGQAEPKSSPGPGVDRAADLKSLASGITDMREHLRRYGAGLAALATAILTGVGFATFHQIEPVPAAQPWLRWCALAAAVIAATGVVWTTARIFSAQRRVLLESSRLDPDASLDLVPKRDVPGLTRQERKLARRVLHEHAQEQGATSARMLELRALRLARVSRDLLARGPIYKAQADALQREAERLDGVLILAEARAATVVVERRSLRAFRGWGAWWALTLTAAGIVCMLAIAEYSEGQRERLAQRTECLKVEDADRFRLCEGYITETGR